jgi:hypothetical protein
MSWEWGSDPGSEYKSEAFYSMNANTAQRWKEARGIA